MIDKKTVIDNKIKRLPQKRRWELLISILEFSFELFILNIIDRVVYTKIQFNKLNLNNNAYYFKPKSPGFPGARNEIFKIILY